VQVAAFVEEGAEVQALLDAEDDAADAADAAAAQAAAPKCFRCKRVTSSNNGTATQSDTPVESTPAESDTPPFMDEAKAALDAVLSSESGPAPEFTPGQTLSLVIANGSDITGKAIWFHLPSSKASLFLPATEYDAGEYKVGNTVLANVVGGDVEAGQAIELSRGMSRHWEEMGRARESGEIVKVRGLRVAFNNQTNSPAGLVVIQYKEGDESFDEYEEPVDGSSDSEKSTKRRRPRRLQGFIPVSRLAIPKDQISEESVNGFVGEVLGVKVYACEPEARKLILDRLPVARMEAQERAYADSQQVFDELQAGEVVTGRVTNTVDALGAFVEIAPGLSGLVPRKNIPGCGPGVSVAQCLDKGDVVRVQVVSKKVEGGKRLIAFDAKGPQQDEIIKSLKPGDKMTGSVVRTVEFGSFVHLENEHGQTDALLHRTQVEGDLPQAGDEVQVVVLEIDAQMRRVNLGLAG
jgi:ribosomal protein S1